MLEESTFCLFNGKIMKNGHHLITFLKVKGHFHWPNVYTSLCRHEITKYCHMHTLREANHISIRNLINTPTQSTTMEISIKMLMLHLKRHFSIFSWVQHLLQFQCSGIGKILENQSPVTKKATSKCNFLINTWRIIKWPESNMKTTCRFIYPRTFKEIC